MRPGLSPASTSARHTLGVPERAAQWPSLVLCHPCLGVPSGLLRENFGHLLCLEFPADRSLVPRIALISRPAVREGYLHKLVPSVGITKARVGAVVNLKDELARAPEKDDSEPGSFDATDHVSKEEPEVHGPEPAGFQVSAELSAADESTRPVTSETNRQGRGEGKLIRQSGCAWWPPVRRLLTPRATRLHPFVVSGSGIRWRWRGVEGLRSGGCHPPPLLKVCTPDAASCPLP